MNILISLTVYQTGGAEVFAVRLANELFKKGHKVYFFDIYKDKREEKFCKLITENNAEILEIKINPIINSALWKFNLLFSKTGYKHFYKTVNHFILGNKIKSVCKKNKISVVNSHTYQSDLFFSKLKIPLVITMHGDYEAGYNSTKNKPQPYLNTVREILKNTNHLIYVADKNLAITDVVNYCPPKTKIYVGLNKPISNKVKTKSAFQFLMIARGIEQKGWEIAIKGYIKNRIANPKSELILIYTETEYLTSLKSKYSNAEGLVFYGYSANPLDLIAQSDCVILPSYSECCPTTLIEAMSCGIPCIGTDVGEVKEMLEIDGVNECGYIYDFSENDSQKMVDELAKKMNLMIFDKNTYEKFKLNSIKSFEKFDFNNVVNKYIDVFNKVKSNI